MFFDASRRIVLILLDVEEGTELRAIETECGVTVSPVCPAEVIVYQSDSHVKVVFDAVYGALPDGTIVVALKNASGAFPTADPKPRVKLLLNPYQVECDVVEVLEPRLVLWMGGCPICGKVAPEEIDAFEDDADDDDEDEDDGDDEGDDDSDPADDWKPDEEEPAEFPMPRRFTMDMLRPSLN